MLGLNAQLQFFFFGEILSFVFAVVVFISKYMQLLCDLLCELQVTWNCSACAVGGTMTSHTQGVFSVLPTATKYANGYGGACLTILKSSDLEEAR